MKYYIITINGKYEVVDAVSDVVIAVFQDNASLQNYLKMKKIEETNIEKGIIDPSKRIRKDFSKILKRNSLDVTPEIKALETTQVVTPTGEIETISTAAVANGGINSGGIPIAPIDPETQTLDFTNQATSELGEVTQEIDVVTNANESDEVTSDVIVIDSHTGEDDEDLPVKKVSKKDIKLQKKEQKQREIEMAKQAKAELKLSKKNKK
ncbi:hypothetical protein [Spiroplasma clarkii]|uniref:Uncharacterized protein n=1 Tax=Spiroplasma clarkii TaxID=2139 RepID=A0A2K8KKU8_9MOLU|nr:hypothetical protein [Spiroplasma clarkii]ATX70901.1 hypothetical protein SCLAR_v1c05820 [Spiroplasma clarkii]